MSFGVKPADLAPFSQQVKSEQGEGESAVVDPRGPGLAKLGGIDALFQALQSDPRLGLKPEGPASAAEYEARRETFGRNTLPDPPVDTFFQLFVATFDDTILLILMAAATVSLIIGLTEDLKTGWIDGVAIWIAVFIVAIVTAVNDYQKQQQFLALKESSRADSEAKVIRGDNTKSETIPIDDLCVGDIVVIDEGDAIPADGIVLRATNFKTQAAALTGESDHIAKDPEGDCWLLSGTNCVSGEGRFLATAVGERSCEGRIIAGASEEPEETPLQVKLDYMAQLIGYVGTFAAVATFIAIMIMLSLGQHDRHHKWYEVVLEGFIIAVTIIVVAIPEGLPLAVTISLAYSTMKMFAEKNLIRRLEACETMGNATDICSDKTGTLTKNEQTVTEGYFGTPTNAVRVRCQAADQPGHIVFANTDFVGEDGRAGAPNAALLDRHTVEYLAQHLSLNSNATNDEVTMTAEQLANLRSLHGGEVASQRVVKGDPTEGAGVMLVQSWGFEPNTLRRESQAHHTQLQQALQAGAPGSSGGAPDAAAASAPGNPNTPRIVEKPYMHRFPFSSDKKRMGTVVELDNGRVRLYATGAAEKILELCTQRRYGNGTADGAVEPVNDEFMAEVNGYIDDMASRMLRTIAFAYKDFPSRADLPQGWDQTAEEGQAAGNEDAVDGDTLLFTELTFVGVYGIKDPLREDVKEAVASCKRSGITVRMCTGDKLQTAMAIARECGILEGTGKPHDMAVMDGERFRNLSIAQLDEALKHLRVLARAKPHDKNILVRRLNGNLPKTREAWEAQHPDCDWDTERDTILPGYYDEWSRKYKLPMPDGTSMLFKRVVGVTGDGTNDAPALKAADVGLAMGISGTNVAKDASDIVILDDKFSSIVNAVKWGRSVYDNIRKFLQFQLTVNVVALAITFIAAVSNEEPPLNPVMMLWVNLIMDTMGALALGTEAPSVELLDRKPFHANSSLISPAMWRNIFFQSGYQLILLMVMLYAGRDLFGVDRQFLLDHPSFQLFGSHGDELDESVTTYMNTLIFNAFVFAQVFNEFNSRRLYDEIDVFSNLSTNALFMGVIVVTIGLQVFIIEVGGLFTKTTGLIWSHWLITVGLGAIALPVGLIQRFVPAPDRPRDFATYYIDEVSARDFGHVPLAHHHSHKELKATTQDAPSGAVAEPAGAAAAAPGGTA